MPLPKPLDQHTKANPDRNTAILAACRRGGYSMKAIGHHFGLSYSMVIRVVIREPGSRFKSAFVLVAAGLQVTDQHLDPGTPYAMTSAGVVS